VQPAVLGFKWLLHDNSIPYRAINIGQLSKFQSVTKSFQNAGLGGEEGRRVEVGKRF
jgi:hypothetical protein